MELKVDREPEFGKPQARYECALCDDSKVLYQKAEPVSRKAMSTLEGYVEEVHPAWEDDYLVLKIESA
jgi:hypothetical protein